VSSNSEYRPDIQVLRGLAVLAVLLFHAKETYFPLGYLGVDVFFMISGYVVTPLILRIFSDQTIGGRLSNLREFFKRRFYRLAPALAVTLTISAVLIFLLGPIGDHHRFARQGISTLLLVGNVGAAKYSGDYFSPNPNPLVHTWSLSVEEQIYISLPLVLIILLYNRRKIKKIVAVVLLCVSVVSFTSFLFPSIFQPFYSLVGIELASQFSFYSPIDRLWQFTIGGLVYLFQNRNHSHNLKVLRRINFPFAIAVIVILFGSIHISLKASSILASLISATVIIFKSLNVLPETIFNKLKWFGDRSYSIYLVHMPLLYLAKYSQVTQIEGVENRIIQSILAVCASILLGAISFSKIENKFRDASNKGIDFKTIPITIVLTLVLPLLLFVSMDIGQRKKYWGLDRNVPIPVAAWELDPKCNRQASQDRPCLYAISNSTQTVLLIGDSHAGHLSQAVIDAARIENWSAAIWTTSSCPVQFQRSIRDFPSDFCLGQNQKILKWIEEVKPNAIMVSQYVRYDSSQSDLSNALSKLYAIVPNILLIENNPIFPDEEFMIERPLILSAYQPPKEFPRSMMVSKHKYASNKLADWARDNGISTMNFDSLFCTNELCTRFSNKQWLYWDDDHFSAVGAELTIPKLAAFLQKF
jgi:peptidoglycan/LPS O-acetylase OafA/YrhL